MNSKRDELHRVMKGLKFGVEIETVRLSLTGIAATVAAALGGQIDRHNQYNVIDQQGRTWKAVPDGSLSGPHSGELVSPILTYEDMERLQTVVRALRAAGAKTDRSCGLHIHVGAETFDAGALVRLLKMVHKQERLIEKALGTQPARLGHYCRPIDAAVMERIEQRAPRTIEEVKTAWYGRAGVVPSRYCQTRYRGLNMNSYFFRKTIEIRAFEGTLHAGELKSCVQFALALAAKALTSKSANGRRRDYQERSSRYDFRVFLLGLGFIGEEFKTARLHLTKRLQGSAAWKGERPGRVSTQAAPQAVSAPQAAIELQAAAQPGPEADGGTTAEE
jgi:hypothetical protein